MKKQRRTTPLMLHRAAELRKNQNLAEAKLWFHIRNNRLNGFGFRRQHAIGHYIVDFCSPSAKLIIEVDGSQHLSQEDYDKRRTEYLESRGYKVLRFWTGDIMNHVQDVLAVIQYETKAHQEIP